MPVYIMQDGDTDRVKIGWSSVPERRLRTFQTHHHSSLTILRLIEGKRVAETWMHRRFADRRISREWFVFCDEMLTVQPDVPPPRAKANRWPWSSLPPSQFCVYCGSANQSSFGSVCTDCRATLKRLGALLEPVRSEGYKEFHARNEGREIPCQEHEALLRDRVAAWRHGRQQWKRAA